MQICLQNNRPFFVLTLKQTKAGPRSSGAHFLVLYIF